MKNLLLFSILSILSLTLSAQTKTWVGPSGGNFNIADNWNPTGIPGATHDVIIPAGSDLIIAGAPASVKSFDLQGNAMMTMAIHLTTSMASSISSNAVLTWNEGGLSGGGTITNNGTINLMTSVTKNIANTLTLINNGTINFNNSGDLVLGYGNPTLNNATSGTINLNSTGNITYSQGIGTLVNSGVLRKAQNNGVCEIQVNITNNGGTISVEQGTLKLNSGNVTLNDGTYDVATGNAMEWTNNYTLLGTLTGQLDGQLNLSGFLKVEPSTEAIFDFNGPSGVNWTGGSFHGNGTLTNQGILNLTSTNVKNLSGTTTLKNDGIINVNSVGVLILGYGNPTLSNTVSGIINLNSVGSITYSQGIGTLVNSGVLRKAQNNGVCEIQVNITNIGGTISVEQGTLKLNSSNVTLNDGTYNVAAGNAMEWTNNYTLLGTLTGQLDGQFNLSGFLKVEPSTEAIFDFNGPSGVNWTGGSFQGNGTLTNQGILNLTSTNVKNVSGTTTLKNDGIINVNSVGVLILGYGNPTLSNTTSGIINLNTVGSITYSQGTGSLINSGMIKKTQDSGLFEIVTAFTNNNGTISVEEGTLKLNYSASLIGGTYNVTAGNIMEWTSNYTLLGTLTGQLDGQLNLSGLLKVEPSTEAIFDFNGPSGVNWVGGNIQGNGTLTNKGILNLIGSNSKNVSGTTTLKNDGIINVNSAGILYLGYGNPTLNNDVTGIINLNVDGAITYSQGIGTLVNSGLIKKEVTNGTFNISANTNNINQGKIICESGLLSFGTYTGNGILGGNGSVKLQSNTIFEGTISPGGFPGTLTHTGNFKSSVNTILATEIYGPASGTQYDVFHVDGNAIVDGNVEVALTYAANQNDEFVILTANAITSCNLPATVTATYDSHNYTFDVMCNPDNVTLKVSSIILGTEETTLSNLSLYPNPTNGNFTIDLGKEYPDVTVQIYNMTGQVISSEKYASARTIEREINDSVGIYFIKVSTATEKSKTLRILKQ